MARNIWCYKAWHFNDLVFQAIGPWFPAKTTIWNKLPKCKWPPCKRSSFYLLELSPQCLPAPPCKVMHICQSLRLISVSGPAICIVLTSSVVGVDWFFLHDMERNITHTHVKENYCKHSLFYPSNWHANHAPPETGYTEILSLSSPMFSENCNFGGSWQSISENI